MSKTLSYDISIVKPTRCTISQIYFILEHNLHVSDGLSVHHQEPSNLFYFGTSLYMFWRVFPSIIRSHQIYFILGHHSTCFGRSFRPSSEVIKLILFWDNTLHVSDGLSVHHQESKTVHTASYHTGFVAAC